jgi:hypothetical protein
MRNNGNYKYMQKLFILIIVFTGMFPARGQDTSDQEVYELFLVQALRTDNIVNNVAPVEEPSAWSLINGNYIMQIQSGDRNHSLIGQIGGAGNIAKVLQQGNDNWAGYGIAGKGQWGICQVGCKNYDEVKQFGDLNKSEAYQYGNYNEIYITQYSDAGLCNKFGGYVNKAKITQTGDGNYAVVTQISYQ